MNYRVNTSIDPVAQTIKQTLFLDGTLAMKQDSQEASREIGRQFMHLQEAGIRDALIQLGWTPPVKMGAESPRPPVSNEAFLAALEPIKDWYQSDEEHPRDPLDILRNIVSDLQSDRAAALVVSSAAKDALKLCHQIEQCGTSPELTEASVMASNLRQKLARCE